MEKNERQESKLTIDRDAQIQVLVNSADDSDGMTIDLGRVFRRMKLKRRIYAWVLVLCLVIGACAPLLMYQFNHQPLTVSSVVTLNYAVDNLESTMSDITASDGTVSDNTAPDGTVLDLNQITSSYVLQNALDSMTLSEDIGPAEIRSNVVIERILTEESRRKQEVAASMVEDKNSGAYQQVQELELKYDNTFVVSLKNGFSRDDEDDRNKIELPDGELRQLLDRILSAYNDYLVLTYADIKLPDDEISAIDVQDIDILESLDQLRTAMQDLYDYCYGMPENVKAYRSWRTGRSLTDWMETLETVQGVNVEYLYSHVYTNSIVKDKNTMITNYQFQLRDAKTQLDVVNEQIATVKSILEQYKNDEIYVSMQESDAAKSTRTTTDYYNDLILQQTANYAIAEQLKTRIVDLQDKIASLDEDFTTGEIETSNVEEASAELTNAIDASYAVYEAISDHMAEYLEQPLYTTYAEHSAALGKSVNFLVASMKKIIIGMVLGAVIACGLWFMSALLPEFRRRDEDDETEARTSGEEAAEE